MSGIGHWALGWSWALATDSSSIYYLSSRRLLSPYTLIISRRNKHAALNCSLNEMYLFVSIFKWSTDSVSFDNFKCCLWKAMSMSDLTAKCVLIYPVFWKCIYCLIIFPLSSNTNKSSIYKCHGKFGGICLKLFWLSLQTCENFCRWFIFSGGHVYLYYHTLLQQRGTQQSGYFG